MLIKVSLGVEGACEDQYFSLYSGHVRCGLIVIDHEHEGLDGAAQLFLDGLTGVARLREQDFAPHCYFVKSARCGLRFSGTHKIAHEAFCPNLPGCCRANSSKPGSFKKALFNLLKEKTDSSRAVKENPVGSGYLPKRNSFEVDQRLTGNFNACTCQCLPKDTLRVNIPGNEHGFHK